MTDFQKFIEKNALRKTSMAKFLGVSNAFVTQLCSGARSLPDDKKALIKANQFGWDTTMFDESRNIQQSGQGNTNVVINGKDVHNSIDNRQYFSDSPDVLKAQIDLLDARIKEKDAQIKEKDAQIRQLLDILSKK